MEQEINEENIENNLVSCSDPQKAFAIKSTHAPRLFFQNLSHKNKIRLFSISVKFGFSFLYKTMTKQTMCLNNSQKGLDLDCSF